MKIRKNYFLFAFVFYALTNSEFSIAETYKISEYFPIKNGYRWEYTTGERYFTSHTYTNQSGYTGQLYGTDTYEYAPFMNNEGNGLMTVAQYEIPEYRLQQFEKQLILIPEIMSIGEKYITAFYTNKITTLLEKKETITVPAGTFQTIRYKITVVDDEQRSFFTYLWFAKGIGLIKIDRENVYPPNSGCLFVCRPDNNYTLVNTPAELTSYKIDKDSKNIVLTPIMGLLLRQSGDDTGSGDGTVVSANRVWMDRNLGATRVATSMTDTEAYGDLYQWGRLTDGHEKRTSSTTPTLSPTDVPGHNNFIVTSIFPDDWRTPQNATLWQGESNINNPCPAGFRLPTEAEWVTELNTWGNQNSAGAFASPLKLVPAGWRDISGTLDFAGSWGYYWSSTVHGSYSRNVNFNIGTAGYNNPTRAHGLSVRCIKD